MLVKETHLYPLDKNSYPSVESVKITKTFFNEQPKNVYQQICYNQKNICKAYKPVDIACKPRLPSLFLSSRLTELIYGLVCN